MNGNKTCATCKHWRKMPENKAEWEAFRSVPGENWLSGAVRWRPDGGVCQKADFDYLENDELMFVQDGSGYFACLVTKAEFGCVLHEKKIDG